MLDLVPVTFREANAFVEQHHRHHGKVVGHKFSIAAADTETGEIVGVAIVGRPVSRHLDAGSKPALHQRQKKRLLYALCCRLESGPRYGVQKTGYICP